jgi:hypothetical protein
MDGSSSHMLSPSSDGPTLEMSIQDSPFFREEVNLFELDLEEFVKWLDSLLKSLKIYTDDLSRKSNVLTCRRQ